MKAIQFVVISTLFLFFSTQGMAKVSRYGERYCNDSRFECVKIQRGQTWESLWPSRDDRDIVRRLNRMNVSLQPGMIIAVPKELSRLNHMAISPFPRNIEASGEKVLIFNQKHLAWGAYDADGDLQHWGPAAGGRSYCADVGRGCRTVTGDFSIYTKKGAGCKSSKFPLGRGGAPMPHCMFFYRGFAFHGSPEVPGYHASHGCVRLFNEDAKWLNEEFVDLPGSGQRGTRVIVQPL